MRHAATMAETTRSGRVAVCFFAEIVVMKGRYEDAEFACEEIAEEDMCALGLNSCHKLHSNCKSVMEYDQPLGEEAGEELSVCTRRGRARGDVGGDISVRARRWPAQI